MVFENPNITLNSATNLNVQNLSGLLNIGDNSLLNLPLNSSLGAATLPDLIVQNAFAPSSIIAGNNIQLSDLIRNVGHSSASASYTKFYLSKDPTPTNNSLLLGSDHISGIAAGGIISESVTFNIASNTSPGNYYLIYQANGTENVKESNYTNNVFEKGITITAPPLPDLIVQNPSAPTTVTVGSKIQVTDQIKNQGNATAGASVTKFYLSKDGTLNSNDILLGADSVSSIAAGGVSSESVNLNIGSTIAPGNYYLLYQTNATGSVTESNTTNDLFARSITIAPPALPDLIVQNPSAPTTVTVGTTIQVTDQIKNQGNATAGASVTKFYLSKDGTLNSNDILLGADSVSSIAAGGVSSESVNLNIGSTIAPGNYYLLYQTNATGSVTESNTTNDLFARSITIAPPALPDLIVQNPSAPTTVTVGTTIQVTDQIKNQGNATAGASVTKFYLSKDGTLNSNDILLGADSVSSIAAGGVSSESVNLNIGSTIAPGNYYLLYQTNATGSVTESNTTNDLFARSITIAPPALPDLIVQNPSAPTTVTVGTTIQVTDQIKNQGNATAGASVTKFYLSKDGTLNSNDILLGADSVSSIAAGGVSSESVNLNIGSTITPGNYYLLYQTNATGSVTESNTTNNVVSQAIAIKAHTLNFNINYDSSITKLANANQIESAIQFVANEYSSLFSNNVTLNIDVVASTSVGLGQSNYSGYTNETYSQVKNALINNNPVLASSLPTGDPSLSNQYFIPNAEAKALGLSLQNAFIKGPDGQSYDGIFTFNPNFSYSFNETTPPPTNGYDFIGVAEHEFSEIMGRSDGIKASNGTFTYATPYDLFSYKAPGVISTNANVTGTYFSLDKGTTKLNTFNNVTNGGDIRDWLGDTPDAFNAYATPGILFPLVSKTPVDIKVMNSLGWISTV